MDYVPMYAVDKVRSTVLLPAKVVVKIDKRAKERGLSRSNYINVMLFADTMNDPWTKDDEAERQRIINENMRKRKIVRARRKEVKR
jgi:metal-responsive CopG/Arc/MetJ family transcriptional regulator